MQNQTAGDAKTKPSFGEKLKAGWWPDIDTIEKARKATTLGVYAVVITIVLTIVYVTVSLDDFVSEDLIFMAVALAIYAVVGFFIWRNSRIAAVAGLVLFALDKILQVGSGGLNAVGIILMIAVGMMFINAVRGTFARHRLLTAQGTVN